MKIAEATTESKTAKDTKPVFANVGHVVPGLFKGEQGLKEVKEALSRVRGSAFLHFPIVSKFANANIRNLVEMPIWFLNDEDIAQEGLGLNSMTEIVYT